MESAILSDGVPVRQKGSGEEGVSEEQESGSIN
jgi:hypothetical protein